MRNIFFNIGRAWPWVLIFLAALGGIGFLINLFHPKTEPVLFGKLDTAKALAVHAAKTAVTVNPTDPPELRAIRFQEFGWTVAQSESKPTNTSVEVVEALPLDPQVMNATQVLIPVKLYEIVKSEKSTTQKVQIANVLVLQENDRYVVAGPPWVMPDETTSSPSSSTNSNSVDTQPVRPLIDSFLKTWWSGGDVRNDISSDCVLPNLAFQTSTIKIDSLTGSASGEKMQVIVNLSATDPVTGVPIPMQLILILGQPVKDHWLIEQIYPF